MKGFSTKPSIFPQLWSHHERLSLQQRRLKRTQAELASSTQLWNLLDEIENLDEEDNGSQHEETELSQGLPLSPLMGSNFISARTRHTQPKLRPNWENPSEFEKKLLMNPYAQALASPLRYCGLTSARLPKEFLLDFGFVKHPRTGKPWHFPVVSGFLSTKKQLAEIAADNASPVSHSNPTEQDSTPPPPAQAPTQAPTQAFASEESIPELATSPTKLPSDPHEENPSPPPPRIPSIPKSQTGNYYLSSHKAIKLLSTAKKELIFRTLPLRWRSGNDMRLSTFIWRQDMHMFVQVQLRKRAFATLKSCVTNYKSLVLKQNPDVPLELMSAALWLGKSDEDKKGVRLESGRLSEPDGPPPYAMMSNSAGCYIPVYNLPVLMAAQRLQELRAVAQVFGGEMVYLRQKEKTVKLQMELWKLMGYMSSAGEGEMEGKWGGGRGAGRMMWRYKKIDKQKGKLEGIEGSEEIKEGEKNEE